MSRLKSESEKQAYSRAHLGARAFLMMHYLFEVNRCWVKDLRLVGSTLSVHRQDVSKTYRNLLKDGLLELLTPANPSEPDRASMRNWIAPADPSDVRNPYLVAHLTRKGLVWLIENTGRFQDLSLMPPGEEYYQNFYREKEHRFSRSGFDAYVRQLKLSRLEAVMLVTGVHVFPFDKPELYDLWGCLPWVHASANGYDSDHPQNLRYDGWSREDGEALWKKHPWENTRNDLSGFFYSTREVARFVDQVASGVYAIPSDGFARNSMHDDPDHDFAMTGSDTFRGTRCLGVYISPEAVVMFYMGTPGDNRFLTLSGKLGFESVLKDQLARLFFAHDPGAKDKVSAVYLSDTEAMAYAMTMGVTNGTVKVNEARILENGVIDEGLVEKARAKSENTRSITKSLLTAGTDLFTRVYVVPTSHPGVDTLKDILAVGHSGYQAASKEVLAKLGVSGPTYGLLGSYGQMMVGEGSHAHPSPVIYMPFFEVCQLAQIYAVQEHGAGDYVILCHDWMADAAAHAIRKKCRFLSLDAPLDPEHYRWIFREKGSANIPVALSKEELRKVSALKQAWEKRGRTGEFRFSFRELSMLDAGKIDDLNEVERIIEACRIEQQRIHEAAKDAHRFDHEETEEDQLRREPVSIPTYGWHGSRAGSDSWIRHPSSDAKGTGKKVYIWLSPKDYERAKSVAGYIHMPVTGYLQHLAVNGVQADEKRKNEAVRDIAASKRQLSLAKGRRFPSTREE